MKRYIKYYLLLFCILTALNLISASLVYFVLWKVPDFKNMHIDWAGVRMLLLLHNIPTLFVYFLINDPDKNI